MPKNTVKGSQFAQPLFQYSGACAGCGETPYIKLITQLYGDRMMVANATGCSSIYSSSAPSTPYCVNAEGCGPSWASSLFEDNAEYGYGMRIGVEQMRDHIADLLRRADCRRAHPPSSRRPSRNGLTARATRKPRKAAAKTMVPLLEKDGSAAAKEILGLKDYLAKRSVWIIGGDGWAYDIGYGGLDHVLASGEDVNVLVLDTEVYSNTGGQSSKSTPTAAVAKFAASGKRVRKKDLGMMAMSYGYVYVAQVAMGANQAQTLKVMQEAEAYPGAVSDHSVFALHQPRPPRRHGQDTAGEKLAVECGYWHLYRYNPLLEKEGKNPFILDSKEPDWSKFQEFLQGEVRYTSLKKEFPAVAAELFKAAEENARWRYNSYQRLAGTEQKQ